MAKRTLPERPYSTGEAAAALGVTGATIRRLARTGHLKGCFWVGRQLRVPATEITRLISSSAG